MIKAYKIKQNTHKLNKQLDENSIVQPSVDVTRKNLYTKETEFSGYVNIYTKNKNSENSDIKFKQKYSIPIIFNHKYNFDKPEIILKTHEPKNSFLSLILDGKEEWKRELFLKLQLNNIKVIYKNSTLKIFKSCEESLPQNAWDDKIVKIFTEYFDEFHLNCLEFESEAEVNVFKKKIQLIKEVNFYIGNNGLNLYLIGKKVHLGRFFDENQQYQSKDINIYCIDVCNDDVRKTFKSARLFFKLIDLKF